MALALREVASDLLGPGKTLSHSGFQAPPPASGAVAKLVRFQDKLLACIHKSDLFACQDG